MECSVTTCPRERIARGWCVTHYQRWRRWGEPEPDVAWLRFIQRVDASGDCWLWLGLRNGSGYGQFQAEGHRMAHRFIWSRLVGPIPDGLTIDHLCRVRLCVNPDHLEVVTMAENLSRGVSPPALNAVKTHCKYGHAFDVANTEWYGSKTRYRRCRTCRRRINAEYYARSGTR